MVLTLAMPLWMAVSHIADEGAQTYFAQLSSNARLAEFIILVLFLSAGVFVALRCLKLMQAAKVIQCWVLATTYLFAFYTSLADSELGSFRTEVSRSLIEALFYKLTSQILTTIVYSVWFLPAAAAIMIFGAFYVMAVGFLFAPPLQPIVKDEAVRTEQID